MNNPGKPRVQKDSMPDNESQEMLQKPSQEAEIDLRDAVSEDPICPGFNTKDSSSDYGDDSFSDLPSPTDLLLGHTTGLTDRNDQTTSKETCLEKNFKTKDDWIYTDEQWFTISPSLPDSLLQGKDVTATEVAGIFRESVGEPRTSSSNGDQGVKYDNQTTEIREIEHLGKKRRRSLASGDKAYDKRITKKHIDNPATESSASQSQYRSDDTSSGYNQNPQSCELTHSLEIWDDIDPTLLDEFKDIVSFF
ncbi:hypothetical protein ABOM_001348 [Aspergillus bombycis]|uniref:Uncharacterized protein n=1 Tax=Aspergillus bombycis TaxID=109264 RepID=A0A1F8AEC9_9EURO|nr:hypothetical protein ABOM_001348 [Aspergillus bombycis]OGM50017.1 hypothetical protein ABOM_001348 [Aspergillus bombycis]